MYALYNIVKDLYYKFVVLPCRGPKFIDEQAGTWAIVTGAGDGLGRAYAFSLAKRHINVCLIGRTESKLVRVAESLQSLYRVKTKVVQYDFSITQEEYSARLVEAIKPILHEVTVLINNVGVLDPKLRLSEASMESLTSARQHIAVNVDAAFWMTTLVLPSMRSNRKGAILFVSSIFSLYPVIVNPVYCATKACLSHAVHGLIRELQSEPYLHVILYEPLFIRTNMVPEVTKQRIPAWLTADPQQCAEETIQYFGVLTQTYGITLHSIQNHILKRLHAYLPRSWIDFVLEKMTERLFKDSADQKVD